MPHAHELLASARFARLVGELGQRYALVVADTPPVLLVPDVPLVMPHFGACLFVVRAGRTSRSNMEEALAHLPGEHMLGIAVNEAQLPSHGGQYGYYMAPGEDADADEAGDADADEGDDEPARRRREKRS
jgi:tyrosine-protein kinase Etk/Wzc